MRNDKIKIQYETRKSIKSDPIQGSRGAEVSQGNSQLNKLRIVESGELETGCGHGRFES